MEHLPSKDLLMPQTVQLTYSRPHVSSMRFVSSSLEAKLYIDDFFDLTDIDYKEHAWILLLTSGNRVLGSHLLSIGHSHGTFMCGKEILQCASLSHARSIIIVHNHPSGHLKASPLDIKTTKRIKKVLELISVELLDHIIITREGYYSLADENLIY